VHALFTAANPQSRVRAGVAEQSHHPLKRGDVGLRFSAAQFKRHQQNMVIASAFPFCCSENLNPLAAATRKISALDASLTFPLISAIVTSMLKNNLAYIIENDLITATIAEAVLRKNLCQCQVQHWRNGQVAFDQLVAASAKNAGIPDLILLDLDMPVMDGWEFLEALTLLPIAEQTCVFILTSSIHPDDRKKAKCYTLVKGFFSKPLNDSSVAWMQQVSQLTGANTKFEQC
jgi:CheY-like chemotaxis protein